MTTKETSTGPDVTFNYPGKDETVITAYRWDPVESPLAAMLIYQIDAVILTGTTALDLPRPAFDLDEPLKLSALNSMFESARTDFDWFTRDESKVDAYIKDPLCCFSIGIESVKAMFDSAQLLMWLK